VTSVADRPVSVAPPGPRGARSGGVRLLAALPVLVALVGVALLVAGSPVVGALLVALGATFVIGGRAAGSPVRLAARVGGRPASAARDARLVNLADGLGVALGVPVPELRVLDDPAPNAIVLGSKPSSAVLVCTSGLLGLLDRMELEGLLAHELAHVKRGDLARAAVATRALGLVALAAPSGAALLARAAGTARESLADLHAVGVTRYPPGLASALEKIAAAPDARPGGLGARVARLTAGLWCAPLDEAQGAAPRIGVLTVAERAAALREL